jgi:hypothetical protein
VGGSFEQNVPEELAFWLGFLALRKLTKELDRTNVKRKKNGTYFEERIEKTEYPTGCLLSTTAVSASSRKA